MSTTTFTVAFTGDSLKDGTMNVRDLAPALLGVGALFDAANGALNGEAARVNVNVRATNQACFEVSLECTQTIVQQLTELMAGDSISGALNLVELLTFSGAAGTGLFALIKKLKGKQPKRVEKIGGGQVKIETEEGDLAVPMDLLRIYQDMNVREAASQVVEPIGRSGIDGIEFRDKNKKTAIRIDKKESEYFAKPDIPDIVLLDDRRKSAFSIISLAFKEDNKWRLHDGNGPINALITDEDFLKRVDANDISFSKGDILVCDVKVKQIRTRDGLKTDHEVVEVIEHQKAARQIPMDFSLSDTD